MVTRNGSVRRRALDDQQATDRSCVPLQVTLSEHGNDPSLAVLGGEQGLHVDKPGLHFDEQ